ncbi:RNA-binding motifsingle-stranded-interacting protein 3, partial [Aphelenchoides avenae]
EYPQLGGGSTVGSAGGGFYLPPPPHGFYSPVPAYIVGVPPTPQQDGFKNTWYDQDQVPALQQFTEREQCPQVHAHNSQMFAARQSKFQHGSTGRRSTFSSGSTFYEHAEDSSRSPHRFDGQLSETNLYIRGLSPSTTDDELRAMCEPFGKIVSTKAIIDKATNQCKGYGFVDFETAEAAQAAVKSLGGRNVHAQMAKQQEQDPTNLYIANLPPHYTEEALQELLNQEGMVISTRILRNPDGTSRCVGFARMHSKECCDAIIAKWNGHPLDDNPVALVVKLADSSRKPKRSVSDSNSALFSDMITAQRIDLPPTGLQPRGGSFDANFRPGGLMSYNCQSYVPQGAYYPGGGGFGPRRRFFGPRPGIQPLGNTQEKLLHSSNASSSRNTETSDEGASVIVRNRNPRVDADGRLKGYDEPSASDNQE